MAMSVGMVIIVSGYIIGFQALFYCLMTKKGDIEPMSSPEEAFCSINVLVYLFEPLLYDVFSCHRYCS